MGRGQKSGVDYFSHDVGAHNKKTLSVLRSRFGNDGYAFWFIMLELLGEQTELSFDCSDEISWVYLCSETGVSETKAAEVLDFLARIEAIDKALWQNKKIIWCQGFVDRLKDVYKKRRDEIPQKPCAEIENALFPPNRISAAEITENEQKIQKNGFSAAEICGNPTSSDISAAEICGNPTSSDISAAEMQQSKVKESKVNKSKVKQSKVSNTNYGSSNNSKAEKNELYAAALALYEKCIGTVSQSLQKRICALVDDVGLELYEMAVDKARQKGSVHIGYIEAAAQGMKRDAEQKGGRRSGTDREVCPHVGTGTEEPLKFSTEL